MKVRWPNFASELLSLNEKIVANGDVLTPNEAAAYLKLNRRTLYRLAREGKIPATRIGAKWRFNRAALEQYVRGQV